MRSAEAALDENRCYLILKQDLGYGGTEPQMSSLEATADF
jgi:hypothetical protein